MNTLVLWLVILMAAESCVSEFTYFEDGVVFGELQVKAERYCITFEEDHLRDKENPTLPIPGRPARLSPLSLRQFCHTVTLEADGRIRTSYDKCVYAYEGILVEGSCNHTDSRFFINADGRLMLSSSGKDQCVFYCKGFFIDEGRLLYTANMDNPETSCETERDFVSPLWRLVASGKSWFASDSSIEASSVDTSANHCDYSNRRLCTAAEVCPTSPGGQSVAGVTGESSNKALLVEGGTFLDAATCQRLSTTSGYNADGFLCCSQDHLPPRPRADYAVREDYGYFMHKSGKCAHYESSRLVLKSDCKSKTALLTWSHYTVIGRGRQDDWTIRQGTNCIVDQFLGQCPSFQFTNVHSLQDVFTGKCLVPQAGGLEPDEDTQLVERAECGEAHASFVLKRIQGYLKHSSGKCVKVNTGKLVFNATCTSAQQVFYKESYWSRLIHLFSGKCVAYPGSDGTALTLTDCTSDGAAILTYDGTTLGYEGNKCVKPQTGEDSPAVDEELVIQTGCSGAASTFHFADANFCGPCTCVEGYDKHGENCFPINKCETNNGDCEGVAECVYTGPGTSMCVCPPGYQLKSDGTNCDQCPNNNCYAHCQFVDDVELKRVTSLQTHVDIRFVNIKTSDLAPYIGASTTELVVYVHQLTISGILTLRSGLSKVAIFANEILKENGGEIVLGNNPEHTSPGRRAVVKVHNGKLLCQNTYPSNSRFSQGTVLNIYTSNSSAPFSCSANYNTRDLSIQAAIKSKHNPRKSLDAELFSVMLDCAKVLAQGVTFANKGKLLRGSLPVALTQFVLDEVRAAREALIDTEFVDALRLEAKNLMEDLSIRARGFYKVPYLSLKSHEKILILIKDDAKMAIQKYEKFERISQDFATSIDAAGSMTELMTAIVRKNDLDVDALITEHAAALADVQAMKAKLDDAKTALETAKETFEAGVKVYRDRQIANAVFGVLGGITSIFAGGAGGVVGLTIELGSLAEEIRKLQKTLFKITIIMDTITTVLEAADSFTNLHFDVIPYAGLGSSDYYSKSMPEQNDQSLAVMIKEWEVFEAEADAFLGVGTASEISGASDYLAALKTVAIWGRGYHEKSITVQELQARLTKLKTLKNEQHQGQKNIKASRDAAVANERVNGQLLIEMALQKQRLRNIMVEKLMSFCDSYFYNWLSECPVMPTMADDLYALHEKINQGLSAVINAVGNFAPFIPQEFEATIIIKDDAECSDLRKRSMIARSKHQTGKRSTGGAKELALNTFKCPISELKRTRGFLFKLDENNPDIFVGHERVHIDEFEVYFKGAQFDPAERKKTITAWISFTGMMADVFKGTRYEFLAPPRVTEFSYKIKKSGSYQVTQSGKVANQYEEYYDGIAALTTWSVDLPAELNRPSLDLTEVSQVKLKLKGTRIPVKPARTRSGRKKDSGQEQKDSKSIARKEK